MRIRGRLAKLAATAALGSPLLISSPQDAGAFGSCITYTCHDAPCTMMAIEQICEEQAPPGCTSTGGQCGSLPNCNGQNAFWCTGNAT